MKIKVTIKGKGHRGIAAARVLTALAEAGLIDVAQAETGRGKFKARLIEITDGEAPDGKVG